MKKILGSILLATIMIIGFTGGSVDAASKATAKSGVYITTHNTNVRADAGSIHRTVFTLKKGARVNLTHQKYYGSQLWYKVKINGKKGYVLSTLLKRSTAKAVASSKPAKSSSGVVKTAMNLRGIPYRFGGTTTRGFDCSGFIQYSFKKNGKSVSRTTTGQFKQSTKIKSPRPGDLVFFQNTYRRGISHVGIYVGNNKFVHAGGRKSEVVSLSNPYWKSKFNSFRRI
ncbi:peptidoglycan endopeptidase [Sporosarcina sp. PTS2304]|uniref:C40 family peptidase n=1 Tax=Sporosarcina sp. PTS2304 TaxID=2283194 RepID=UPI000E0DF9CE|nr:C40 family peptidase [Sporosarcina sp. PTS2304]AXH98339.1 peptidoglycan endopeptidase [Sporosarcina sp. PTS2304]